MREPPAGLDDRVVIAALAEHYQLAAADLTFLPLGHDASAWVYSARAADGATYFVKLRLSVANPAALLVPRFLYDQGVRQVVAPLPTRAGELWAPAGPYALIVYPFVDGATGMAQGLTPDQWRAYGTILRQIHDAPVGDELTRQLRHEAFGPGDIATLSQLDARLAAATPEHAEAAELAAFWRANRATIHTLEQRVETLGQRLAQAPPPNLLCHADIHTNNLLVDRGGKLWVVDWDEAMLAPRERDLMFVVGGISAQLVGPREEAWFFEGYGPTALDPHALAYYRAAWAVGDIASFGAQVCLRPDFGPLTRQEGLRALVGLFAPGEIVSIALAVP